MLLTLERFWVQHAEWSQKTFGSDIERGPEGPTKHLAKEVLVELLGYPKETVEAFMQSTPRVGGNCFDIIEHADCLMLLFDACRRSGHDHSDLILAAFRKLERNRGRAWPKSSATEPVEHIRDGDVRVVEASE